MFNLLKFRLSESKAASSLQWLKLSRGRAYSLFDVVGRPFISKISFESKSSECSKVSAEDGDVSVQLLRVHVRPVQRLLTARIAGTLI